MEQREILFRGRCIDDASNGLWVYGNLIQGKDSKGRSFAQIEHSDAAEFRQWNVDPSTVGQFTGLHATSEMLPLYEGDRFTNDVAEWVVVFNRGCFCARIVGRPEAETEIALRGIRGITKITGTIHDATKSPDTNTQEGREKV